MVHETGHELGLSGFSVLNLTTERALYEMAHLTIADAVLNYDENVRQNRMNNDLKMPQNRWEPDCSPHPFDIMALYALYQTVNR